GVSNPVTYRNGQLVNESMAIQAPLGVVDSLVIQSAPTEQKVDSPSSRITEPLHQGVDAHAANTEAKNPEARTEAITFSDSNDTALLAANTKSSETAATESSVTTAAENADAKPKPAVTKASRARCDECNGVGKRFYKEETRKRVVTKDVSNGVGPKNYVTYTVTDVVRPGGHTVCKVCRGSGFAN
ncbi:MAG TPA: hypothetical protein VEY71_13010, partial [Chitinophagales bacterium]|nr:hypothetical protein [Chitinophagales bacterium]